MLSQEVVQNAQTTAASSLRELKC